MRRLISTLMVLILLFAVSAPCFAGEQDAPTHNYILIIDNSLSTTGRHSLGSATDPKGMRFDAARLVYENVLSSGKAGSRGKICVIIFCGPEHCAVYGPMDIGEDSEALYQGIGRYLSDSFPHERDGYTDIRTALESARDVLAGFQGDTGVILLTDGINALTNSADPFNEPVNIEANDQSVATVEEIRALGAEFYIVALTAKESVSNTEAFMEFINRMALAGGGEGRADGSFGNVLMATQTDLSSKLLQILMKAESADDAGIQTYSLGGGGTWTFLVPYEGISNETVNLTFMPEELEKIRRITLEKPDKTTLTVYEDGVPQAPEGISVTAERSYLMVDIPSPQPGEWTLTVDSDEAAEVNSVVRFNQNLRIRTDMPESAVAGESLPVNLWVQQYDGEGYVDLSDPDFYAMSSATMTVQAPGENGKTETLNMENAGDHFTAEMTPEMTREMRGEWAMDFQVSNDYWSDNLGNSPLSVVPPPSVSTDGAVTSALLTTASQGQEFNWQLETDAESGTMTVSWDADAAEEFTAELRDVITGETILSDIHSGDSVYLSELGVEQEYMLIATAFSSGDAGEVLPPVIQQLNLEIVSDPEALGGATMAVLGSMVQLAPAAMSSAFGVTPGKSSAESAQDSVASETDEPSGFFGGLAARLTGKWAFLLAGAVVIAAVLALIFSARGRTGERVTGRLKLVCEPHRLELLLLFDGRGSIRVDSPLTKHPDVAKLKGGKVYDVLSHIQVSMSKADRLGQVEGSDAPHMPGETMLSLSCTDPRTGERQVVHIGRLDTSELVLHVYDAGRVFDVHVTNGQTF